jgi:hypothetical protein
VSAAPGVLPLRPFLALAAPPDAELRAAGGGRPAHVEDESNADGTVPRNAVCLACVAAAVHLSAAALRAGPRAPRCVLAAAAQLELHLREEASARVRRPAPQPPPDEPRAEFCRAAAPAGPLQRLRRPTRVRASASAR